MALSDKYVTCGSKKYYLQMMAGGDMRVRKNDGFISSNGTILAVASSLEDAIAIIKADSGSDRLVMRDA